MASEVEGEKLWEEVLRKMLPVGAPLPDEEHLDYSIAVEYEGPPVPYQVPRIDPLDVDSLSIRSSSMVSVSASDLQSIPVAAPILPVVKVTNLSRFNRVRNGASLRELRSPVESGRSSSSVWRGQLGSRNSEVEDSDCGNERGELFSSASSVQDPNSVSTSTLASLKPVAEGRRSTMVTFNVARESEIDEDELSSPRSSVPDATDSPIMLRNQEKGTRKRGVCSRCGKRNRLKEREACIVCDARYCKNCLLKAMGSMPEGRKCVSCLGQPINESKRSSLGKCSRMLSKTCSPLEVGQIMKAEKECLANQLRPEQLIVNGRQLRQEELAEVLGCSIPPQKLKPGRYWYDKDSGLWGKASTRFICSLFSLPVPPGIFQGPKEDPTAFSSTEYLEQGRVQKLLLFGLEGSGTSTLFKQMNSGETGVDQSKPCIYSINQKFKHFSDWLLGIMAMGDLDAFFPAATREYAPLVDELWKDPAIQETYKRREELLFLPDVAKYFLDQVWVMYQLIRINSKGLHDGCKWLDMFEDVRAVIFCVALSDYDHMYTDSAGSLYNKMLASRDLFESLVRHPCFIDTRFVLLLNKYDAFEEKINRSPLTVCEWFWEFSPVRPHHNNQSLAQQAYYFVAMKFKDLYHSISNRKLFVWQTRAQERSSVDEAFKFIREVLKWEEDKDDNMYGINGDESFYSTEPSSSPYIRQE
ncbi:hypothetical protein PVL29_023018 [Vitis rotundifolia]|uniref:Uncharacterized protein n=1 Tax=Vitis rotundifolia TaxID=103349 RepID=A0AA38YXK1_VITRO|nr:hypothetical protein PVL29_023018 [Vitis rotundifolia]